MPKQGKSGTRFLLVNGIELSRLGAELVSTSGELSSVARVTATPYVVTFGGLAKKVTSGALSSPTAVLRDQKESSGEPGPREAVVFQD